MTNKPEDLFREGRLDESIKALGAVLRDDPSNVKQRTFLFELLCFAGDYERARKQLEILASDNQETMLGAAAYEAVLNSERTRQSMFQDKTFPEQRTARGPLKGKLNGRPFSSIADADPRIGANLELFAAGDYVWISLADITSLEMEAPKRLRDLLWAPVKLKTGETFRNRELDNILLPVIYPQSSEHPDEPIRLGRATEWCQDENGEEAPYGQKMLLVDGEEFPILEMRTLEIEPAEA